MRIKDTIRKIGGIAADSVSNLSSLSPSQIENIDKLRDLYLNQMPDPSDDVANEFTKRLIAAASIEIYHAYLGQLRELYVPIESSYEYAGKQFDSKRNIRFINITKWVFDKNENCLEKLVNVYQVLKDEYCNIALVFHRTQSLTNVYLAVTNTKNADNNNDVENYKERILAAIRGNFPGAQWDSEIGSGIIPCLDTTKSKSVAIASNIPAEKFEKFDTQTIEKLLDGVVPDSPQKEYVLILLATPILDVEEKKINLSQYYSGLYPYSAWSTNYTFNQQNGMSSSATVSVNVGAGAGMQGANNVTAGTTNSITNSENQSESVNRGETITDSVNESSSITDSSSLNSSTGTSVSHGRSYTDTLTEGHSSGTSEQVNLGVSSSQSITGGVNFGGVNLSTSNTLNVSASEGVSSTLTDSVSNAYSEGVTSNYGQTNSTSFGKSIASSIGKTAGRAIGTSVAKSVSNGLGKAISHSNSMSLGSSRGLNFGVNFGASFARSSTVTSTLGNSEGITQNFTNFNIKHALELLLKQMNRFDECSSFGMWDFAAYVISEDHNVANNVAHSYLALTQGKDSYLSSASVNLWRGDIDFYGDSAKEICIYLKDLRHPVFGLSPAVLNYDSNFLVYPNIVRATTSLTGHELAYALNFPRKSVAGLPVIECAEFGRNVIRYDDDNSSRKIKIGHIVHMNHTESTDVEISLDSLTSHAFITGSTGSGKSNTIYKMLLEANKQGVPFLVIEPAKGEYKNVFGGDGISVYGTNPKISPLLRINPFSFSEEIHILEHLDRLVEIFNVCWPMYAAMPAVLKSAIEQSYCDCGWDLISSTNIYSSRLFPTFGDVARNIRQIIDSSEYDTENKGAYKGSLLTRLTSLTTGINGIIFGSDEINESKLFDSNVIVDLSRVGSSETKSLIMGILVLKLQEYRIARTKGMNLNLKHITVVEEAHNLLRRYNASSGGEGNNLAEKSVEMLANAIAEMRTYGEGFIIADQAPGLLDLSVIRNTNTKIILRLPDQSDRLLVGRSANLNDDQILEIAKLPRGVAAIYQNDWIMPVLCKIDKSDVSEKQYIYNPEENASVIANKELILTDLIDKIAKNGIQKLNECIDLIKMRSSVLNSNLSEILKMNYLNAMFSTQNSYLENLQHLFFELFNTEDAFNKSRDSKTIEQWHDSFLKNLTPSISKFSETDSYMLISMLLRELYLRDRTYESLYLSYVERYLKKEGIM